MYRLLKIIPFSYCKVRSLESFVKDDIRQRLCAHCNAVHARTDFSQRFFHTNSTDMQSPDTNSAPLQKLKKTKKKNRRTHAEILAVDGYSSKQTRKLVSKMGATQLVNSLCGTNTKNHNALSGSDQPSTSQENLTEFDGYLNQSLVGKDVIFNLAFEQEIEEQARCQEPENRRNLSREKNEEIKKKMDAFAEQQEIARRTESVTQNLLSYLDVCVSCGFLNKAFSILMSYTSRHTKQNKIGKLTNVALYNTLLLGYAKTENLRQVCELMDVMKYSGITPNAESYAACFECVGRLGVNFQRNIHLKEWSRQMERHKISLQSVFDSVKFVGDQKEMVLKACLMLVPEFEPLNRVEKMEYNCPLLEDFNPFKLENSKRIQHFMSASELREKAAVQFRMEKEGSLTVKSVEKNYQAPEVTEYYRNKLAHLQSGWKEVVQQSFFRDLQVLKQVHNYSQMGLTVYPFLKVLHADEYVDIIMKEIRKLAEGSETFSPSMHMLFKDVGTQVMTKYQMHCKAKAGVVDKMEEIYYAYCKWYADNETPVVSNTRVKWQQLLEEYEKDSSVQVVDKAWPAPILIDIGKFLYKILLKDIQLNVHMLKENYKHEHVLPAFYSLFRFSGKIIKEEIKPHPVLAKLFRGAAQENLEFATPLVPMVSPPVPWTAIQHGGHLISNTEIVRLPHQAVTQWERMESAPKQQLYPAFDALNQLGSIPWRINEPMLDVVTKVFVSGGSAELDIPEPPSACMAFEHMEEATKDEKLEMYRQRLAVRRQKAEMYSLWCDTLYRLSLANHYRKEIFWFPHNMDFRGRVYPCPPHLSHMGSDMARSILSFAKGEPLGEHGLDWLKIHVVNLSGLKKRDSKVERLRYANEIMPDIMDSADNPLNGRRWWVKSDEPWQTLAACMEIANAIRSPNPEEYVSYFPIHQDGSCNGLQHYAALGRDAAGALSVNLAPADIPQDVYSSVVALVETGRAKDAANGVKIAQALDGFIKRKVIKQTVMTTVYGVTRYGARLQIAKQLKDIDNFPKDLVWQASSYLVAKTFESLAEMFTSTKEIQDWFTESARQISQTRGKKVEWVTPLGLPVVQPYIRDSAATIINSRSNPKFIQQQFAMDAHSRPNVVKQKNAFPPNFIHSLDSSHMMLTSLYCEQKGITFVSVHDCFWTHPSTVDTMNLICRQQFVALHSQPILEDLSKSLVENYSYDDIGWSLSNDCEKLNNLLTRVPKKGDFDLSKVLESIYFFS